MRFIIGVSFLFSFLAHAQPPVGTPNNDVAVQAETFHNIFIRSLDEETRANPASKYLHLIPDVPLTLAAGASSIDEAMVFAQSSSFDNLVNVTAEAKPGPEIDINGILKKRILTLVILPGIFGEFIKSRPFEEVLSKPSKFRDEFEERSRHFKVTDLSFSSATLQEEEIPFEKLVQVGSIDDENGNALVRVVFLSAPRASLETLGDLTERSAMMNRRLVKYLQLTGDQGNLVLIGYSRGTTYGLEMLAQAKEKKATWLPLIKGMIGLSGVIWGSTSADDSINPASTASYISDWRALMDHLEPYDVNDSALEKAKRIEENTRAWLRFGAKTLKAAVSSGLAIPDRGLMGSAVQLDGIGSSVFLYKALAEIGVTNIRKEYNENILRAKKLTEAALLGANQLRTEERVKWWKTRTLPDHVIYYSLTAVMPNPQNESSPSDKEAFESPLAFANNSFEDQFLLKGRNDYAKASKVEVNDSQVAIPQAMFLPNAIMALNPNQKPLKTKFLGTIGTHHWGAALQIVFDMSDGRNNGFPREALLKSLATQVATDIEAAQTAAQQK